MSLEGLPRSSRGHGQRFGRRAKPIQNRHHPLKTHVLILACPSGYAADPTDVGPGAEPTVGLVTRTAGRLSPMGMRVLLTSPAGLGHIHPMVPLARALVARGHDVLWAAPPDGVDHVRQAGIRAVATGAAGLTHPAEVVRRYPELRELSPAEMPNVLFGKMFGAVATPSMLADLAAVALEWRPDLIVADAAEFAGHIVAAELGVPRASPRASAPCSPSAGWREPPRRWRRCGGSEGSRSARTAVPTITSTSTSRPPALQTEPAPHISRCQLLCPISRHRAVQGR